MNRRDGRFILREKRIQKTLNNLPGSSPVVCITNSRFAKKAKIGRTTFRRHYKTIEDAFCTQQRNILYLFCQKSKKIKNQNLKSIFRFFLFFIYQNKDFFQNDFFHCDSTVINKMFNIFQAEICAQKSIKINDFDFYIYKITFFLKKWGRAKFAINDISKVLKEIMEVTIIK